MAVLSAALRLACRIHFVEEMMRKGESVNPLTKADLLAAVDATDAWIEANSTAYNLALPVAARNNLTATQKAELFSIVALRRYSG